MSEDTQVLDPDRVVENGLRIDVIDLQGAGAGDPVVVNADTLKVQHVVELPHGTALTSDQILGATIAALEEGRNHPDLVNGERMGLHSVMTAHGDDPSILSADVSTVVPFGTDGLTEEEREGDVQPYDVLVEYGELAQYLTEYAEDGAETHAQLVSWGVNGYDDDAFLTTLLSALSDALTDAELDEANDRLGPDI